MRMSLVLCESENAGMLREAATAKNGEKILLKIRNKDCVAIEVCYHQRCYKNYTSFTILDSNSLVRLNQNGLCFMLLVLKSFAKIKLIPHRSEENRLYVSFVPKVHQNCSSS